MMWNRFAHSACIALLAFASPAWAQPARPARAPAVSPEQLALEQKLQGEYTGVLRSQPSELSARPIAIQVLALGNGKFTAWKYEHGLPGAGWRQAVRYEYPGQLLGDIAQFHKDNYTIEVNGVTAQIYAADGRLAGQLEKVERISPTMGAAPPAGALVLFGDGHSELLQRPRVNAEGFLGVPTQTNDAYQDFCMHVEFRTPFMPTARGQSRANSGVYLQGRYELQILDSFGLDGIENECGAIYTQHRPSVNMCLPPMQWQTYDLDFTAARFDASGKKTQNARITVWHNGVPVQNDYSIIAKTGQGIVEGPEPLPTKFQDHNNPVVYRNIWLLPKSTPSLPQHVWLKLPAKLPPQPLSPFAAPGVRVMASFSAGN